MDQSSIKSWTSAVPEVQRFTSGGSPNDPEAIRRIFRRSGGAERETSGFHRQHVQLSAFATSGVPEVATIDNVDAWSSVFSGAGTSQSPEFRNSATSVPEPIEAKRKKLYNAQRRDSTPQGISNRYAKTSHAFCERSCSRPRL